MSTTAQIVMPEDLHAEVKAEVALRNKTASKRFKMADAAVEAFRPWLTHSRSHRRSENQKSETKSNS